MLLSMGVLRFYLCTKSLTDEDDYDRENHEYDREKYN